MSAQMMPLMSHNDNELIGAPQVKCTHVLSDRSARMTHSPKVQQQTGHAASPSPSHPVGKVGTFQDCISREDDAEATSLPFGQATTCRHSHCRSLKIIERTQLRMAFELPPRLRLEERKVEVAKANNSRDSPAGNSRKGRLASLLGGFL